MQCDVAQALTLGDDVSPEVLEHIESCPDCGPAVREAARGRAELPEDGALPPAWLEQSVLDLVTGEAAGRRGQGAGGKPPRRRTALLAAIAAAVVLALVGGGVLLTRDSPPSHQIILKGTAAAPNAAGSITVVEEGNGTRITVAMTGLPTGPDVPYFMWVITKSGTFVKADSFHYMFRPETFFTPVGWTEWDKCGVNSADQTSEKGTTVLLPVPKG